MSNINNQITTNANGTFTITKTFLGEFAEMVADKTAKKISKQIYAQICAERAKGDELIDKRLYNVKLVLQHYLSLREYVNNAVFELEEDENEQETAIEILDSMQNIEGAGKNELAVESIKKSLYRTQVILEHIDVMFSVYQTESLKSQRSEEVRRCAVLESMYMKPMPSGVSVRDFQEMLAERYGVADGRQIRKDINSALERLTALIFGMDGLIMYEYRKRRNKKNKVEDTSKEQ